LVGDERSYTLKIRSGCAGGGGKGALVQNELSATLSICKIRLCSV
jgi:hypothetical protein